jgi:hypothetical protein
LEAVEGDPAGFFKPPIRVAECRPNRSRIPTPSPSSLRRKCARLEGLKHHFQKKLRNRPTALQRALIDQAAGLTLKSELAIYDPRVKPNAAPLKRAP